jgi:hypothetical protein
MIDLEKILGKAISVKELAEYLGVNETSIRKNFQQYGGIKVGRHYRFFTKEVISAMQKQTEKQIYSSVQAGQDQERKGLQHNERGQSMGSRNEKNARQSLERHDKHNLFG